MKKIDGKLARELLPKRQRVSNKGTYGKAAIVAGSVEYTGAAYLAAAACLRSGAGYTALFTPKEILPFYILKAPEILLKSTNEGGRYAFNEEMMRCLLAYRAIAYGMGMGVSEEVFQGAKWLLENYGGKLILDADGLNSLALYGGEAPFQNKKCEVLLTPHGKEFSRLSGIEPENILADPVEQAKAFSKKHGVTVLLKNAYSVVTDGERTLVNEAGNSGQAKGGSGDVLSGVIAGLCASGASVFDGGIVAAYLTGTAAELAVRETGEYSLTPTDVIAHLGKAFLSVVKDE